MINMFNIYKDYMNNFKKFKFYSFNLQFLFKIYIFKFIKIKIF